MRLNLQKREEIRRCILAGDSNDDIIKELHCSPNLVTSIRKELGMSRKSDCSNRENAIVTMLINGDSNVRIMKELHCGAKTVRSIRNSLVSNGVKITVRRHPCYHMYDARVLSLLNKNVASEEIVKSLGCSERTVKRVMRENNMSEYKTRREVISQNRVIIEKMFIDGKSDKEIAKQVGYKVDSVARIRRELDYVKKSVANLDKGKICALYKAGWSISSIQYDVECSEEDIITTLKEFELVR